MIEIVIDHKIDDPEVLNILDMHQAHCEAETPLESCHRFDAQKLRSELITFYVAKEDGKVLGVGALADIGGDWAELKSMHVLDIARGRGVGAMLLDRAIAKAREMGKKKIGLETGAQPNFHNALRLYEGAGFIRCAPFGTYQEDVNSIFMLLNL